MYYADDHEGSVTHLINGCTTSSCGTGTVLEKYAYDAFGAPTFMDGGGNNRNPNATIYNNRFLFTGREYAATYRGTYVSTFSFYEYRARAYNPVLGRFMSEDPKLFGAGDYNLFRYCHNDPMDLTDPMGLDSDTHNWQGNGPNDNKIAQVIEMERYARYMGDIQWGATANNISAGAIGIGMAGYAIAQASNQMAKAITAAAREFGSRFVGGRDRSAHDAEAVPLGDQQLGAGLGRKAEEVSAANVLKMSKGEFFQFQRRNNTDKTEFYNTKWFHYEGGITPLSGKNWFGHEINNYAVGEGFAARGWSVAQMSEAILARRYAMMPWNAIHGRDPGGIMGGEIPWAIVGYSYYEARSGGY